MNDPIVLVLVVLWVVCLVAYLLLRCYRWQWRSALSSDGLMGVSIVKQYAQATINNANAVESYSSESFKRGTNISGVYKVPQTMSVEERAETRKELDAIHGGLAAGGRLLIADGGADLTPIVLTPDDQKFLASRNFSIEEICRWFGVPLHLVQNGNQQSYNSNEANGAAFQTYTLLPLCKRIEQQINRKLFPARDYYVEFDFSGLLRPSWKDLVAAVVQVTGGPALSKNEGRGLLGYGPIADGDTVTTPMNMATPAAPAKEGEDDGAKVD